MKAVITGATGVVGMALIEELLRRDAEILVLCRELSGRAENIREDIRVKKIVCALENIKDIEISDKKYDVFFHLAWDGTTGAARNDNYLQIKNIEYTLDAVRLASRFGCKCFVGVGSQAEYGRAEGKIDGETPVFAENGYGIAKYAAGRMSRILCGELGIRQVWARILSVYGPFDNGGSMVMHAITELKKGGTPKFTAGEQMWDYIYSEDAARALVALAERGKDGMVYCIGSGHACKLKEYIEKIRDAAAPGATIDIGALPYAEGQVMYLCADISDLERDTGFSISVDFEEGIKRTVEWFDKQTRQR